MEAPNARWLVEKMRKQLFGENKARGAKGPPNYLLCYRKEPLKIISSPSMRFGIVDLDRSSQ
jgi:hypothetical protein